MEVLGRPLVERLGGLAAPLPWGKTVAARLSRNLAGASGREDYVRVRLRPEGEALWADPVLGPSGLLSPMVKSDGLVMIPLGVEGMLRGEEVRVRLFGR
jgi:molybdopterin molybdotransferase